MSPDSWSVRPPIGRHAVVILNLDLPAAVAPIELLAGGDRRRLAQILIAEIEMIGTEHAIVDQPRPGNRRMLLSDAEKAAEAQHGVGDVAGELVDHQALDGADLLAAGTADRRAFHPVARDQAVGLRSRGLGSLGFGSLGLALRHLGLHGCLHVEKTRPTRQSYNA